MKKMIMMVAVAMMTVMSVNAQSENYYKHEFAVSYGSIPNSAWMSLGDAMGTAMISLGTCSYDDGKFTGPISAEYFYHINPVIGVGSVFAYTQEKKDILFDKKVVGEATSNFITVLPAVKFNWLRKKNFGLYSKVAAGATFRSRENKYDNDPNISDNHVVFNFQLTGIGIEAGVKNVWAFAEFGMGEQGMALAGLRLKF